MKRNIKRMLALFGVVLTVVCSVAPSYYVYAEDPVSQEVTSDDNIVQKILDFALSNWGAVYKTNLSITNLPTTITNNLKEMIASAMNGGGIYVDENGDYVFSNDISNQLFDAMQGNSNVDARVVSNFSDFSYQADGYVNSAYLEACNKITAWGKNFLSSNYSYILYSSRFTSGNMIYTELFCFAMPESFAYLYCTVPDNNGNYYIRFSNSSGQQITVNCQYCVCSYNSSSGTYSLSGVYNSSSDRVSNLHMSGNNITLNTNWMSLNAVYNAFPYYTNYTGKNGLTYTDKYYSSRSLLFSKDITAANSQMNQTQGVFSSYTEINKIDKTVLEDNDWSQIYNVYVNNVNNKFQNDPTMTAAQFRNILKTQVDSIISQISEGNNDIVSGIDISNRYLQAISVDVRNIIDKLNETTNNGTGGGITPEQYNAIMSKLISIENNAIDIADSVATISSDIDAIYEDTHGISSDMAILLENTGDTNTNLVAIDTLLQQINNKLRNRRTDNPLPDPDFWDNLDDELDDYTNTMMEDLIFKLQMIGTVLQGVVPFGYLAVLNVMVNALAEEPEAPVFEIDLQSNGATAIPVNWQGTIDLSWVDDIMPIVRSFEVILFIIGLIWATFNVFTALGSLL